MTLSLTLILGLASRSHRPHPTPPPPRDFKTWTTIKEQYGPFELPDPQFDSPDPTYDLPPVDLGTNLDVDFVYEVS